MHWLQRSVVSILLVVCALRVQAQEMPVIDFQRYYPHLIAISEQVKIPEAPYTLQWKLITIRDEQDKLVWVTLRRFEGEDRVTQEFIAAGPLDSSEESFRSAVAGFTKAENIEFEIVDLRGIRSAAEFAAKASELGWGEDAIAK